MTDSVHPAFQRRRVEVAAEKLAEIETALAKLFSFGAVAVGSDRAAGRRLLKSLLEADAACWRKTRELARRLPLAALLLLGACETTGGPARGLTPYDLQMLQLGLENIRRATSPPAAAVAPPPVYFSCRPPIAGALGRYGGRVRCNTH